MGKGHLMLTICFFKAKLHLLSSILTCKTHFKPTRQFLMDKINYNPNIFLFLLSNVLKKEQNGLKIAMHIHFRDV